MDDDSTRRPSSSLARGLAGSRSRRRPAVGGGVVGGGGGGRRSSRDDERGGRRTSVLPFVPPSPPPPGRRSRRRRRRSSAAASSSSLLSLLLLTLSPLLSTYGPPTNVVVVVAALLMPPPPPSLPPPAALPSSPSSVNDRRSASASVAERGSLLRRTTTTARATTTTTAATAAFFATPRRRSGRLSPLLASSSSSLSSTTTVPSRSGRTAGGKGEDSEAVDGGEGLGPSTTTPPSKSTGRRSSTATTTSTSTSGRTSNSSSRRRRRRHPPYRYDGPSDSNRYAEALAWVESYERRRLYATSCALPDELSTFVDKCLESMGSYARLGRGERCESVGKYMLSHLPRVEEGSGKKDDDDEEEEDEDVALARRATIEGRRAVLHGWCNEVTRLAEGGGVGAAKSRRRAGPTRGTSGVASSSSSSPSRRRDDGGASNRRAASAMRSAARSAEASLRALLDLSSSPPSSSASDPASSMTTVTAKDCRPVIRAHARCDDVSSAVRVLRLLEAAYERSNYDEPHAPGAAVYTTVMHAAGNAPPSKRRKRRKRGSTPDDDDDGDDDGGPETAEALLDSLERLHRRGGGKVPSMKPDAAVYNAVLDAWSKRGTATPRGEAPWARRRRRRLSGGEAGGESDSAGSAAARRAAARARAVFDRMAEGGGRTAAALKDDGEGGAEEGSRPEYVVVPPAPNARSHALLIYSYCKAGMVGDAMDVFERLVDALLLLESRKEEGGGKGQGKEDAFLAEGVDARCFKVLLSALAGRHREAVASAADASSSSSSADEGKDENERDVDDDPDSDGRVVVPATTDANRYALLMNRVLNRTLDLHLRGKYDEDVAPDVRSYATAINAWADARSPEGSKEALQLLGELERSRDETGSDRFRPDVACYNAVVDAVAKGGGDGGDDNDPAERAGSVVKRMERLAQSGENPDARPDTVTYNTLIDACLAFDSSSSSSSSHDDDIGSKNEKKRQELGIDRAEQTLRWMIRRYESTGDSRVKPNARSFSSVIEARSKSRLPGSTVKAEALLDKMEELHEPDGSLYGTVVEAWVDDVLSAPQIPAKKATRTRTTGGPTASDAISSKGVDDDADSDDVVVGPDAARRAHDLLLRMEELYAETGKKKHMPATSVYLSVMDAWRTCGGGAGAGDNGAAVVAEDMIDRVRALRDRMYPPRRAVSAAAEGDDDDDDHRGEASARSATFASDREVLDVLKDVDGGKRVGDDDDGDDGKKKKSFVGNTRKFNKIVRALAKSGKPWAGARAEDVLNYMLDELTTKNRTELLPDVVTFNCVVDAHARVAGRRSGSARRAEAVLTRLESLGADGILPDDVEPDVVTYNSVLHAYANSREEGSSEAAERILRSMEEEEGEDRDGRSTSNATEAAVEEGEAVETGGGREEEQEQEREEVRHRRRRRRPKPDVVSYATAIRACRGPRGGHRAESILKRMHERHRSDRSYPRPDDRCFNEVLHAWAESGDRESGDRSEMLLRLMEAMVKSGMNDDVRPDVRTYNIVLHAHANAGAGAGGGGGSRRSAERAQDLLDSMERSAEAGRTEVRPDMVSYNTVLSAWSKCGGRAASLAAERTLRRTFRRLEEGGEEGGGGHPLRPDAYFFSTVINAFSKSGEKGSARRAEGVLEELEAMNKGDLLDFKPDAAVYNALLNCWAKSGEWGAAQRAEEILRFMEDRFDDGDVALRPDARSYTSVLDALARSRERGAARRAEEVLDRMAAAAAAAKPSGRRGRARPTVHAYTAVINAWARSRERGKAAKARAIFRRMEEDHRRGNAKAKPNVFAYNAVLNACEYSRGVDDGEEEEAEEAFKIACLTFDELRTSSDLRPNHVTYGSFLGVVSGLMPAGDMRNDIIEAVFRRCCGEGQVGDVVMKKLGEAAPPELYEELLEGVDGEDLPAKWMRHVIER